MGNCGGSNDRMGKAAYAEDSELSDVGGRAPLHEGPVLAVTTTQSGFVSCGDDKRIAVVDLKSLLRDKSYTPKYLLGHQKAVGRAVLLGDDRIVTASRDLALRQWNISTGECEAVIENTHSLNISALCRVGDDAVFSGSRDYSVKKWDLKTKSCVSQFSCPRNIVTSLCYGEQAGLLFQGSEDLCVRAWDARAATANVAVHQYGGYVYFPLCLALHSDQTRLVSGGKGFNGVGCGVVLWDVRNATSPVHEFKGHTQDVTSCLFSPSLPDLVISGSKDGTVNCWNSRTLSLDASYSFGRKPISSICSVGPDTYVVASMDGSVSVLRYANDGKATFDQLFNTASCDDGEIGGDHV